MIKGFRHLPSHLDRAAQEALLAAVRDVLAAAPLFVPTMPRSGRPFSVRMSNCGPLGWVSDKMGGYRYQQTHPEIGRPWPHMPDMLLALWAELTGYDAPPEACLVNYYGSQARLGSHQDKDEQDMRAPLVSISLGDTAVFHIGGRSRKDSKTRLRLTSGDVAMLAGPARLAYHGVDRILSDTSDLLAEGGRFNLTLRRVTVPDPCGRT